MKLTKNLLYFVAAGLLATGCSEDLMDDINFDESSPAAEVVDAKFQITDAITSAGYSTWGGAYAWYVSSYTEQLFGTGNNQLMKAELRQRTETAASTTFNNEWNATYSNLMNLRQIFDKCAEGGINANQPDLLGMAQVIWVITAEALTDLHGDIPYSEAVQGNANLQPKLDSQESIYTDLFKKLDDAIANLAAGESNVGSQDLLYGNDCDAWTALAYALKARLLLNTSYRNPGAIAQALTAAQTAEQLGFDGAQLSFFNGIDCDNPWAAYFWSRYYTGCNQTVVDLMDERNDPRLDVYSFPYFSWFWGYPTVPYAPAGDETLAKETYGVEIPTWLDNGAAELHLFSKSELYFIIAECQARLGQDPTDACTTAIEASFDDYATADPEYVELDPTLAADYIAGLGTIDLREVMVQKYLAQARDEQIQTYNDLRRCRALGEEYVAMRNPKNTAGGQNQWPLRLPYGNSDVIANPNVAAAFGTGNDAGNYLFTENVWLFGGSR